MIIGSEVDLGVPYVLPGAFAKKAVHHALIVAFGSKAGAHQEPQFDERIEVPELVQPLQLLERADGKGDMIGLGHGPKSPWRNGSFQVKMHFGFGKPGNKLIHEGERHLSSG